MRSFIIRIRSGLPAWTLRVFLALFIFLWMGSARAHGADAPPVRANYAAFSGAFAPLWIAADRNLFAKHGLWTSDTSLPRRRLKH